MNTGNRIAIIDIGSNSVRMVIYELLSRESYRVIDESKASARLSEKADESGAIPLSELDELIDTMTYFRLLCQVNRVNRVRTTATAAIRNAANRDRIIEYLEQKVGMPIEVLSGEDEAFVGFVGTINSTHMKNGFVVDIGGGSTEISLFLDRKQIHSVSFPFGAVNTAKQHCKGGDLLPEGVTAVEAMVEEALEQAPWATEHPGLPILGLGGTFRSLGKIVQRRKNYSLPIAHSYEMSESDISSLADLFLALPFEQRKKIDGLSKDRADIIVPGIVILETLYRKLQASRYVVSGAGLRDGLFLQTLRPDNPILEDVLGSSMDNLLSSHPAVQAEHTEQVCLLAGKLFDALHGDTHRFGERERTVLIAAARLYRIGISIDYYNYHKHTFYLIAHSRIFGLTHREKLMCALVASFKSKSRCRQQFAAHRDILDEVDLQTCVLLGTLLQLAVALDRSETQPVASLEAAVYKKRLALSVTTKHTVSIEQREVERIAEEFKKAWRLEPVLVELD